MCTSHFTHFYKSYLEFLLSRLFWSQSKKLIVRAGHAIQISWVRDRDSSIEIVTFRDRDSAIAYYFLLQVRDSAIAIGLFLHTCMIRFSSTEVKM